MDKKTKFLGELSIGKLLFKMSLPATIGMLVMTLYNVIDSIFVGQFIGVNGLTAITIVFPIMMLIISISMGIGIGTSSIISLNLGEKNYKNANKYFGNFIFLIFSIGLILTLFSYFFIDDILILFGSSSAVLPLAKAYFSIIILGIFFQMFIASSNNIIRAEGAAKTAMTTMLIGAILNIILDYVFVVIIPLGISGIALSTVVAQFFSFSFSLYYFIFKSDIFTFSIKNIIPDFKKIKKILSFGFPSFARQSSMSLIAMIMNNSLKFYGGDIAIAAYGIIFRLMMILIMPAMGILQGTQAIIGFNYGAKKYLRVKEVLKLSIKSSTIIIFSVYIFIMLFPRIFITLFTTDEHLIKITIEFTRIMFITLPVIGFQFIAGGFFQSIGKPMSALIVSLLRQFILLLPLILILPLIFGLNGVWYAYPISDIISFIIVFFIFKKDYNLLK